MKKESYDLIMKSLADRVSLCGMYLNHVKSTDDLSKMTVADLLKLRTFCRAESGIMSRIVMIDLYHILGMGNMTPVQTMKFVSLIKRYLSYRSDVKAIAGNLSEIDSLPAIPSSSKFALSLCDLTLAAGPHPESAQTEVAQVSESSQASEAPIAEAFELTGVTLKVPEGKVKEFRDVMVLEGLADSTIKESAFRDKMRHSANYCGVKWAGVSSGFAVGTITSQTVLRVLRGYCEKKVA